MLESLPQGTAYLLQTVKVFFPHLDLGWILLGYKCLAVVIMQLRLCIRSLSMTECDSMIVYIVNHLILALLAD